MTKKKHLLKADAFWEITLILIKGSYRVFLHALYLIGMNLFIKGGIFYINSKNAALSLSSTSPKLIENLTHSLDSISILVIG